MKYTKIMTSSSICSITLIFMCFFGINSQANAMHISETKCTTSCVVVTNSETGITSIEDCCGGRVTTTFLPHPAPEAPRVT
jgi:hypothetical protein